MRMNNNEEVTTMGARRAIYITGGARSGKSSFAESLASEISERVLYVATSEAFDQEMKDRVKKHQAQRPSTWDTVEIFQNLQSLRDEEVFLKAKVLLLDCLGFLLNNLMYYSNLDFENLDFEALDKFEQSVLGEIEDLVKLVEKSDKSLIIVSNEIGMGIVPNDPLSRAYRDILGRLNRRAQELSNEAYILISGIPLQLK